nr:LOW QUALITY PROTEIN: arachidonate 5-lipoxygenase-activating protein-like [Anas platyrhynchos]
MGMLTTAEPSPQGPAAELSPNHISDQTACVLCGVFFFFFFLNSFFASKVEHESKHCNGKGIQRPGSSAFDRVYTANQNCGHAYPTFLAVLWCAGLLCSQAPAAFAGLMYLFVRQKYFVGYLGERTQSLPATCLGNASFVPVPHVRGWDTQLLSHLLLWK